MDKHSGLTTSVWMETPGTKESRPLPESMGTEVCVVGAGISGLTTAYLLAREGKKVVVIDDRPIGAGETERTTAHLSYALDDRYTFLERRHGVLGSRLAAESHRKAIEEIEAIIRAENIPCDFERLDGYLFVPPGVSHDELEEELEAARRAGLGEVTMVERAPLPEYDTGPALRFPGQGQFHPLKYLNGLAAAIERLGGRVYSQTHASNIQGGSPATVETTNGLRIACAAVVVATNVPVNDRVTMHTKQAPYRTYVVGLRVPSNHIPKALYWDTAQDAEESKEGHSAAYHYVRLQKLPDSAHELLIVGGEDHKTGQADDAEERWKRLEDWTRERFPHAGAVEYRWSGQVIEPVDGMAFIGRNPGDDSNVFIATGDSGHGMTHGTIAGMLIRDLILGRENEWERLYDPSRKVLTSVGEFARENLNVAAKYGELLSRGEIRDAKEIPPDCGAVMRRGAHKVAIYRDEEGHLHEYSAVCPHLKCIVHWNHAEKSWDCPCHGSRFNKHGEVLNGPAITDMAPVKGQNTPKTPASRTP